MTPTYTLDDDQFEQLVQDVADRFDEVTLTRGFQYYKQGRVTKLTLPSDRLVKAIVDGGERYSVSLDLDSFDANRCDCPVNKPCKHMVATLLKYADLHNRPVSTLVNAKSIVNPIISPSKPAAAPTNVISFQRQLAAKKAEAEAQLKEQASRIPEMTISQWHELFEQCTAHLKTNTKNSQYIRDALSAIYKLRPPELPAVIERLFALHAHWFVLFKLTDTLHNQPNYLYSYLAYHTHEAMSELLPAIEQSIASLAPLIIEPGNGAWIRMTLEYLRIRLLMESRDAHYFLSHYQQVWSDWICPHVAEGSSLPYQEELQHLESSVDELDELASLAASCIAQAGMYLYLQQDSQAWELIRDSRTKSELLFDCVSPYLLHLVRKEHWTRLTDWLTEIAPLLGLRRNPKLQAYSEYWELAVEHIPEAELRMWDTLASMLPQSRALYEDRLLARGQWERWMDYHLSMDSDPLDFRVTDLAPIEKNAPELLLPFYHQAVERYVLHKNRDSYKSAVKMLKRLAKLYKKIKQESRWEQFFASFVNRNSRLRALHEELRKGKLLS
jgi:uncharacterized Zn finger protein